jgi:hypothetical protein
MNGEAAGNAEGECRVVGLEKMKTFKRNDRI